MHTLTVGRVPDAEHMACLRIQLGSQGSNVGVSGGQSPSLWGLPGLGAEWEMGVFGSAQSRLPPVPPRASRALLPSPVGRAGAR